MLALSNIDAGYGTFQALFGVSLEVNAGEAIGVIGPNGAGKTTLMRVISGLIRPTAGQLGMEGADLLTTPPHQIVERGIAHVARLPHWAYRRQPDQLRCRARVSVPVLLLHHHQRAGPQIAAAHR